MTFRLGLTKVAFESDPCHHVTFDHAPWPETPKVMYMSPPCRLHRWIHTQGEKCPGSVLETTGVPVTGGPPIYKFTQFKVKFNHQGWDWPNAKLAKMGRNSLIVTWLFLSSKHHHPHAGKHFLTWSTLMIQGSKRTRAGGAEKHDCAIIYIKCGSPPGVNDGWHTELHC